MQAPVWLPKQLLQELRNETPFTARELQRLWTRFQALDTDSAGTIPALVSRVYHVHIITIGNAPLIERCAVLAATTSWDAVWSTTINSDTTQELKRVNELLYNPFSTRIAEVFSDDGAGQLSFKNFLELFSVFSPGASFDAKVVFLFAIWDFDGE